MPPATSAPSGKLRRTLLLILGPFILIALGPYGFVELGPFLAKEDTLHKADAILVLSGTPMRRPLEAADLYFEGYGSRIVLTRQIREGGERALVERGVPFVEDIARVRDIFQLGIPKRPCGSGFTIVPPRSELHELMASRRCRYHLRRAGFAFRRELRGTGVQLTMRGTRYDGLEPNRWWRRRGDIREIVPEVPKLIAYPSSPWRKSLLLTS